ncbi:MAG TPA: amidase [Steroidobacteraceae bacterium]|nr:amidase [Steroidobacteraceae bacterium]
MATDDSLPLELRSATELLSLLRTRKLSAVELLEGHLARVERFDREFNLVVARDVEGARRAARLADEATARGDTTGRLHGLPMTLKDVWEAEGMTATCGFTHLANHRPTRDADAVARLRDEGAVFFGKTNVPVGAGDHQSYNPVYGRSNNPWNPARTVGGSSGGAAGAVAAGLTALELGSDIGGSIRCPAHFCGVYGHKPSFGIVPMRGHIPPMPDGLAGIELGVAGPIARSAQDLELALDVLASPGELERGALRIEIPPSRQDNLRHFRVALWADSTTLAVDARCLGAMEEYASDLRRAGVHVDAKARPDFDPREVHKLYMDVLFSIFSGGMPEDALQAFQDAAKGLPPGDDSHPARIARAIRMSHHEFMRLAEVRERLFRTWRRFFESYDLMLCPIMPTVAFPHDTSGDEFGHVAQYHRTTLVDGVRRPYLDGLQWPGVATVANLPATAVPTGRLIDGLPMGLQVIGPYLEDRTPLRFAQLAEQELGGYVPPPAVR